MRKLLGARQWFSMLIIMSFIVTFLYASFKEPKNIADKAELGEKNLNKAITNYILSYAKTNYINTDKQFECHEILGKEEKDNKIIVYLYTLHEGYSFIEGYFRSLSAGIFPMVMEIQKKNDKYKVINHKEPLDNNEYIQSIKKLFPKEYVKKVLNYDHKKLIEDVEKQVKEWNKENQKFKA